MLVDDEVVEADQDWVASVDDALQESIDRHGLDPERLLDDRTTEGAAFLAKLDALTDSDPDDPAFARAVEAYAIEVATERRVTESGHTAEDVETIQGRVLEAKGTAPDGGRIFRVQILKYGDSKNGNRYTESVMRRDAHRYEGAKAYDHHRTAAELQSSTLTGLAGSYRNVEATGDGLYGDLHLLPGATHVAEALDATIVNQAAGRPPLVGISHDVMASFKPAQGSNGRRVREAVAITSVQSADVVADPSAGGQAVRVVQGGIETTPQGTEHTQESTVPVTKAEMLAALSTATSDELSAVGLARASESTQYYPERVIEGRVTEGAFPRNGFMGKLLIDQKIEAAGLPTTVRESFTAGLPQQITEADVDAGIATLKSSLAMIERAGLAPTAVTQVTRESRDKQVERLDAFFASDFTKGYHSLRHAYMDITGYRPRYDYDEDVNRRILRESFGPGYDSGMRATESMDSTSWAQVLGDSVTRRLIAEYNVPALQLWRRVVSSVVPVSDFRTQRVGRIGGYGILPTVLEGGPYQPLTSPGDEEATYALGKKGGTEDFTLEMIANDDRARIPTIPRRLGRAAAQTLQRFVFDFFTANPNTTYDSTAWFHNNHNNTTTGALSDSSLTAASVALMKQTAYGDSLEVLGHPASLLLVPPELRSLAFQLTRSAVAIPSSGNASDIPNVHNMDGIEPIVVPFWTDANDWFAMCDPADVPTIEIGFYNGRQEPELFTQSDPNMGSVFNSDTFTMKIRFIFSGTPLDHRGVYRTTN